jgi:hypothetical protein
LQNPGAIKGRQLSIDE